MKKIFILIIVICFILTGSGCSEIAENEPTFELYIENNGDYSVYHIQSDTVKKVNDYMPCYVGGTPKYARNSAGEHFDTDGHGMYQDGYGQLDDYYIDHKHEIYLYNSAGIPKLLLFENGQAVDLPIDFPVGKEFRVMKVKHGYCYLISLPYRIDEEGRRGFTVFKINLETYDINRIDYEFSYNGNNYLSSLPGEYGVEILKDNTLLHVYSDTTDNKELLIVCKADKTFQIIEPQKTIGGFFYIFETDDGFSAVESIAPYVGYTGETFYITIRSFNRNGDETQKKTVPTKLIQNKINGQIFAYTSLYYYDGILYLPLSSQLKVYLFEYNLEKNEVKFRRQFDGSTNDSTIVRCVDGKIYSTQ